MPKQELIVPTTNVLSLTRREPHLVTVDVPGSHHNGLIESTITRLRTNWNRREVESLTHLKNAQAQLVESNTRVIDATIRNRERQALFVELPERLGHELAVRRVGRAEELRAVQHVYEVNEVRRMQELTAEEAKLTLNRAELTHARTTLVDAEQQLKAQREHGYFNYVLAHKKKTLELLDVELSEAERRAILKQHLRELEGAESLLDANDVSDEALYTKRAEMNASGLDPSRLDALIEARKGKRDRQE